MTWQDKMKESIEAILNYGYDDVRYVFILREESKYEVEYLGNKILDTETSDNLASHWKDHVRKCVNTIYEYRTR